MPFMQYGSALGHLRTSQTMQVTQPPLAAYAFVNGSGEVIAPGTIVSDALNSTCGAAPCNATWTASGAKGSDGFQGGMPHRNVERLHACVRTRVPLVVVNE